MLQRMNLLEEWGATELLAFHEVIKSIAYVNGVEEAALLSYGDAGNGKDSFYIGHNSEGNAATITEKDAELLLFLTGSFDAFAANRQEPLPFILSTLNGYFRNAIKVKVDKMMPTVLVYHNETVTRQRKSSMRMQAACDAFEENELKAP